MFAIPFTIIFNDGSAIGATNYKAGNTNLNLEAWIYNTQRRDDKFNALYGDLTNITIPKQKLKVKDPNHLTTQEISTLTKEIEDANPFVYTVTVSDTGLAKLYFKYPDVSRYILPDDLLILSEDKPATEPDKNEDAKTPSNPTSDTQNPETKPSDKPAVDSGENNNDQPATPTTPSTAEAVIPETKPVSNQVKQHKPSKVVITNRVPITGTIHAPILFNNPNYKIALLDENGNYTGKYISTNSTWKYFEKAIIKGRLCYRLGSSQQWVPADYLTTKAATSHKETKYTNIGYVAALQNHPTWKIALYNQNGKITSYLKPNSSWKIFAKRIINGQLMYRLGSQNQWIPAKYISVK